ncbi:MAG TPA: HD domain-containing protein [Candidatus Bilamarchaeum sp.]|nr:HD domain-containing protein [Candidatus Bilamarchaeum sp.]
MIVKDEIHGTVEFNELEERIIDSEDFQRLRRIRQMSVTNLVYPGANHTRFEHSIGTAHLSAIIARKLGLEPDLVSKVKLYGLLHDIGHTAFSHEGEDIVKKYVGDHEELGHKRLESGPVADILSENYRPGEIAGIGRSPYGSIITSDLGSDRMDYLKRDALNTGVAYGIIDIDRIVHTLAMREGELCLSKGGLEAAEYLLVARFMMFSTVYMHHTVRIATAMLYRAMEGAIKDKSVSPEEFARMDDEQAMARLLSSPEGGRFAGALQKRRLLKEIGSFGTDELGQLDAARLEKELGQRLGSDIIVDYPHQFFKPVGLKVVTDEGLLPMLSMSKLIQSLERAEKERMRVLVLGDESLRGKKETEGLLRPKARKSRRGQ